MRRKRISIYYIVFICRRERLSLQSQAPAVTEFEATTGATPEISAVVSDFSGISQFSFSIDGVIKRSDLSEYYDAETGLFTYPTSGLTNGSHTAKIYAKDTFGNETEDSLVFEVDLSCPTVRNVTKLPETLNGGTTVSAEVTGDRLSSVFLNVETVTPEGTSSLRAVEMKPDGGVYSAELAETEPGNSVKVWVSAFNASGNSAESAPMRSLVLNDNGTPTATITKVQDGTVEAVIANVSDLVGKDVILTVYDAEGAMISMMRKKASGNSIVFDQVPSGAEVKLFVWSDSLQPLCAMAEKQF